METILFVFIGMMCLMLGMRVYCAEDQNKVFTKVLLKVTDVKKYNQACGVLIIGFGVVAEITLYFMVALDGIASTLCTLGIIIEALITMVIYRQIEKRLIKKN